MKEREYSSAKTQGGAMRIDGKTTSAFMQFFSKESIFQTYEHMLSEK